MFNIIIRTQIRFDDDVEHRNLLTLLATSFIDLQIEPRRE